MKPLSEQLDDLERRALEHVDTPSRTCVFISFDEYALLISAFDEKPIGGWNSTYVTPAYILKLVPMLRTRIAEQIATEMRK